METNLKGLYVITDNTLTPNDTILNSVQEALLGGAKIVQFRDKTSDDKTVEKISLKLQQLCFKHNAIFILNDKVDVATRLNLNGLHIGKEDYSDLGKIRENFKGILGVSCYGDINSALKAQSLGADYVAFGACFASSTKPNASTLDLEIIKKAKELLHIPVCAIGGITLENIDTLMRYKPDMAAIISDIWKSDDITKKAMFFTKKFK